MADTTATCNWRILIILRGPDQSLLHLRCNSPSVYPAFPSTSTSASSALYSAGFTSDSFSAPCFVKIALTSAVKPLRDLSGHTVLTSLRVSSFSVSGYGSCFGSSGAFFLSAIFFTGCFSSSAPLNISASSSEMPTKVCQHLRSSSTSMGNLLPFPIWTSSFHIQFFSATDCRNPVRDSF